METYRKCGRCKKTIPKKEKVCPFCGKKQPGILSRKIIIYFSVFFGLIIVGAIVFPAGADGKTIIPSWFYTFCYLFPAVVAIFYNSQVLEQLIDKGRKNILKKFNLENKSRIPKTKKAQEALAAQLLDEVALNVSLANKATHISLFVDYYDDAIAGFEALSKLDKVTFKGSPQYDLFRLKDEFQWHLCDALCRQKETVASEIREKYKNSREFQERQYERFKGDIDSLRSRFSDKTREFAAECLHEIERMLGPLPETSDRSQLVSSAYGSISTLDFMEGHQFEHWCADLLQKIGFQNVEVTQGSGDQGVDILAIKDGIKYAIQCKCYASDLGNKPIQEVNTGRAIYHCQIGAVMTNRHFTAGGKVAAKATGVLLWDRDWIRNALESIKAQEGAWT